MKTKILTRITLLLLLFFAFSCSKDSIEDTTNVDTINLSVSYKGLSTNGPKLTTPLKYLKIAYKKNANRELVRNSFLNLQLNTSNVSEIDDDTDLFAFHVNDQSIVENFLNMNSGFCIVCNYLEGTEYVSVIRVIFPPNTTDDEKDIIQTLCFNDLVALVVIEDSNTETWVMKGCCISNTTDISGDPIPYWPSFEYFQN